VFRALEDAHALYRRLDKNARVLEYTCVEFVEPLLYGALRSSRANKKEAEMKNRFLASTAAVAALIAVGFLATASAAGQAPSNGAPASSWTSRGRQNGQPDLQGVWDYRTITPLERPAELGTKEFFTDEEVARFEKDENQRQNRDLIDPEQERADVRARRRYSVQ